MNKKYLLLVSVLVLAIALAACSSAATTASTPATAYPVENKASTEATAGTTIEIAMVNYSFSPQEVTIKKGTTVTWTNQDSAVHTVTSDTPLFDSGDLAQGKTFSYTFTTTGTFAYHCIPHKAKMTGTIIVTD